jgi:hypothetical protein
MAKKPKYIFRPPTTSPTAEDCEKVNLLLIYNHLDQIREQLDKPLSREKRTDLKQKLTAAMNDLNTYFQCKDY